MGPKLVFRDVARWKSWASMACAAALFMGCGGGSGADAGADASADAAADTAPTLDGAPDGGGPRDMCGDMRTVELIFNGRTEPTLGRPEAGLTPGQVWAVGQVDGSCSATLVTPTWVLTASHCGSRVGSEFCVGESFDNLDTCLRVAQVERTGTDMTLLRLESDATMALPGLEPVPVNIEANLGERVGERAEAGGTGQNNISGTPNFGLRYFGTVFLLSVRDDMLQTDGRGMEGVCGGDSGGPVFVLASDGSTRVAGTLFGGDSSCVGVDNWTRTDAHADFIRGHAGEEAVTAGPVGCGMVTAEGACRDAQTAVFCEADVLQVERCPIDQHCALDAATSRHGCVSGPDPCEGLNLEGECAGQLARWCQAGALLTRDCAACGEICVIRDEAGGAVCADPSTGDPCETGELDFIGRCAGDVVEYCDRDSNAFTRVDCGRRGGTCGFVNDDTGFWCVRG